MSRPTEAIATKAKLLQLLRQDSWAGARGFRADDPEPLLHGFWVGARGTKRIPHPKPHKGTTNGAEIATGREVAV